METTNITPAIAGNLFMLKDKEVYEMPRIGCNDYISVAVAIGNSEKSSVFLGSGSCCHGHIFSLYTHEGSEKVNLFDIVAAPTNVRAILPMHTDVREYMCRTEAVNLLLVAGSGCSGDGVWLIDPYKGTTWPIQVENVRNWDGGRNYFKAKFRVDGDHIFVATSYGELELTEELKKFGATPLNHETVVQDYRFPS